LVQEAFCDAGGCFGAGFCFKAQPAHRVSWSVPGQGLFFDG
jgi:hypothetical protein